MLYIHCPLEHDIYVSDGLRGKHTLIIDFGMKVLWMLFKKKSTSIIIPIFYTFGKIIEKKLNFSIKICTIK